MTLKYDIARFHADITASKHENEGLRGEKAHLRGGKRDSRPDLGAAWGVVHIPRAD
jgi:hypothetical protein